MEEVKKKDDGEGRRRRSFMRTSEGP